MSVFSGPTHGLYWHLFHDDERYPVQAEDIESARAAARQLIQDGYPLVEVYVPGEDPECHYPLFKAKRDEHGNIVILTSDRERAYDPKRR